MCIGNIAPRVPFLKPSIAITVNQAVVAQISRSEKTGLAFLLAVQSGTAGWQLPLSREHVELLQPSQSALPSQGTCKGGPLLLASISVNKSPNDLSKQRPLLPFHRTGKQTGAGELRLKSKQPESSQQHKELGNKQTKSEAVS